MDMTVIINQMIQLFLIMAIGYGLFKVKVFDVAFNKRLTSFLLTVTTPCLIISSVLNTVVSQFLQDVLFVFLVAIIVYIALPIIGWILVKIMKVPKNQQGLYIFMTVFSNIGFIGFPVMQAIFGSASIFYTAIFNMIFNFLLYTVGMNMMLYGTGEKVKFDPKKLLSPASLASIVALLIYLLKVTVPMPVASALNSIGSITSPLAMLIIGSTLANIPIKEVFNELRIYPYTIIKQIILPIILFPVLNMFIKDPLILGVTFIMLAMPVGNSAVLFATEYGGDIDIAAKNVFITTLVSVVTIPFIVGLFLI